MAAWSEPSTVHVEFRCVACDGEIAAVLARLGSTKCHDCRGDDVTPQRGRVAELLLSWSRSIEKEN